MGVKNPSTGSLKTTRTTLTSAYPTSFSMMKGGFQTPIQIVALESVFNFSSFKNFEKLKAHPSTSYCMKWCRALSSFIRFLLRAMLSSIAAENQNPSNAHLKESVRSLKSPQLKTLIGFRGSTQAGMRTPNPPPPPNPKS